MAGEVRVSDTASFLNVVEGEDLSGEVGFDDVLEHGEHGLFKHAAARFQVGIDVARVRGILPPVGELVGVRVEDGIQPKRLHGAPRDVGTVETRSSPASREQNTRAGDGSSERPNVGGSKT